jgi:hypothetical protein
VRKCARERVNEQLHARQVECRRASPRAAGRSPSNGNENVQRLCTIVNIANHSHGPSAPAVPARTIFRRKRIIVFAGCKRNFAGLPQVAAESSRPTDLFLRKSVCVRLKLFQEHSVPCLNPLL